MTGIRIARVLHPPMTEEVIMRIPFTRSRRSRDAMPDRKSFGDALTVLSVVGILAGGWHACRQVHRQRVAERTALPAERLETWEAEGGRLPESGGPESARALSRSATG